MNDIRFHYDFFLFDFHQPRITISPQEAQEQERMIERTYTDIRVATERWRRVEDQALARLAHHTAATRAARNLRRSVADARARCRQLVGSWLFVLLTLFFVD